MAYPGVFWWEEVCTSWSRCLLKGYFGSFRIRKNMSVYLDVSQRYLLQIEPATAVPFHYFWLVGFYINLYNLSGFCNPFRAALILLGQIYYPLARQRPTSKWFVREHRFQNNAYIYINSNNQIPTAMPSNRARINADLI